MSGREVIEKALDVAYLAWKRLIRYYVVESLGFRDV